MKTRPLSCALLLVSCFSVAAGAAGGAPAQDNLQAAKRLYASAAYDDALGVLARLRGTESSAEIEQYRVLCLVALGRQADADAAARAVVNAYPTFVPEAADTPPRVQELFARARKDLLPDIARRNYLEAKAAFDRKDGESARALFTELIDLIDAAGPSATDSLSELRILAAGFLDLTRALTSAGPAKPATAEPPSSTPLRQPEIIPPVAIRQTMPQWVPTDAMSRQASFVGAVRVSITASGQVDGVTIEKSVHPAYDRLLLQAARAWEYLPARSDGVAVPSEQLVQVQLKPRQ